MKRSLFWPVGELLFILAMAFALLQPHLWLDFWNDELYTLRYFAFRPLSTIATDYHVPNNHIFFNLLNRLYLSATGVASFDALLSHPFWLRQLYLLYAFLTLSAVYLAGKRWAGHWAGLIAGICLAGMPGFLNFVLQARGYGLSMLLLSVMLYGAWGFCRRPTWGYWWVQVVAGGLLFYTVASNLYVLLGLGGYWFGALALSIWRRDGRGSRTAFWGGAAAVVGIGLGLLAYGPVFGQVFSNPYVTYSPFQLDRLAYPLRGAFLAFIGMKWLLLPLLLLGAWAGFRRKVKPEAWLLASVMAMPFLLAFAFGNPAPQRVFVVLAPAFALLSGLLLEQALQLFAWPARWGKAGRYGLALALAGYVLATCFHERQVASKHLMEDIKTGGRSQDAFYQYYSVHYEPRAEVSRLRQLLPPSGAPVGVIGCEPHGLTYFLAAAGIAHVQDATPEELLREGDTAFVFSSRPLRVLSGAFGWKGEILSPALNYHTLLRIWVEKEGKAAVGELFGMAPTGQFAAEGVPQLWLPDSMPALSEAMAMADTAYLLSGPGREGQYQASWPKYGIRADTVGSKDGIALLRIAPWFMQWPTEQLAESTVVSGQQPYSPPFWDTLSPSRAMAEVIWLRANLSCAAGQCGTWVAEWLRGGERYHWAGEDVNVWAPRGGSGRPLLIPIAVPDGVAPGDVLKTYFWSHNGGDMQAGRASLFFRQPG